MPGLYVLRGVTKNFDWGGYHFIPGLLGEENRERKPYAEYWLGIHPLGTAAAETGGSSPTPLTMLAPGLPFLLKILDVRDMLSIQVHPSHEMARKGFEREEALGISLESPERNYKDPNHKPELSVALDDFWLLQGFKTGEGIVETLETVTELRELLPVYYASDHTGLYTHIMEMPQADVNRILRPLLDNLATVYQDKEPDRFEPDFWAVRAAARYDQGADIDRGIFSIYLLNIIHLNRGEAIFQDAGVLHAYLEGPIVEIMANSDNVLRGGLTSKHINIPELLKNVVCEGMAPEILLGDPLNETETLYNTPYPDFKLSRISMAAGETYSFIPHETEIILLTSGKAELDDDQIAVKLEPGSPAAVVFPGQTVYLAAATGSTIFRATGTVHSR